MQIILGNRNLKFAARSIFDLFSSIAQGTSARAHDPFISVSLATVPDTFVEAKFFGLTPK